MNISIEVLRNTPGIGPKTLERIIEQYHIQNDIEQFKSEYQESDKYKIDGDINLWKGDCIELMNYIPDSSIDMVLCDLPYGITNCKWDEVIPFDILWKHYKRIIKPSGTIVLFGNEPFSTRLRESNLDQYKYDWKWKKTKPSNFLNCNKEPLRNIEDIMVFCPGKNIYNPQGLEISNKNNSNSLKANVYGTIREFKQEVTYTNYPVNVLEYGNIVGSQAYHPTQKPTDLLEYLIKTYTDEGMVVLDNTMGVGSTGISCINTGRKFIGIELEDNYYNKAVELTSNKRND